jgi:hypothetical protein
MDTDAENFQGCKTGAPNSDRFYIGWNSLFRQFLSVFICVHRWLNLTSPRPSPLYPMGRDVHRGVSDRLKVTPLN